MKTPAERQFLIDDAVQKYCRENPEKTHDDGFAAIMADPAYRHIVAAMRTPNVTPEPVHSFTTPAQKKAGAKFFGLAKAAQNSRGITWDQAWAAIQIEEPELLAAMGPEPTKTWAEDVRPHWFPRTEMQTQG